MHCRLQAFLKNSHKELYTLYRDACVGDKLRSPCTLILPDASTAKALRAKLDGPYDDRVLASVGDTLKALILTQPHPPPLDGSFRNVVSQDVAVTDGSIGGVKVEHVANLENDGRPLFCIYQAKGSIKIDGAPTAPPGGFRKREQSEMGGARRVPRRRGGGDSSAELVNAMINKHHNLISTNGRGCSPFAEAMCYQLASLMLNCRENNGLLAAVRLVASYDPAVFFLSLGLGGGSPVIPAQYITKGAAPGSNYETVLGNFLDMSDVALVACFGAAGCDIDKVRANINSRRQTFNGEESVSAAYASLGSFFTRCGIPLTSAQKQRADRLVDS